MHAQPNAVEVRQRVDQIKPRGVPFDMQAEAEPCRPCGIAMEVQNIAFDHQVAQGTTLLQPILDIEIAVQHRHGSRTQAGKQAGRVRCVAQQNPIP